MFKKFDSSLFDDPSFKEDSVREVVILPILERLGYYPSGNQKIIRSKSLVHPFIYIGTRQHKVRIIPDYTLYYDEQPIIIVDAKSPIENLDYPAHVQQAYSYAIHPDIKAKYFSLCNGRDL